MRTLIVWPPHAAKGMSSSHTWLWLACLSHNTTAAFILSSPFPSSPGHRISVCGDCFPDSGEILRYDESQCFQISETYNHSPLSPRPIGWCLPGSILHICPDSKWNFLFTFKGFPSSSFLIANRSLHVRCQRRPAFPKEDPEHSYSPYLRTHPGHPASPERPVPHSFPCNSRDLGHSPALIALATRRHGQYLQHALQAVLDLSYFIHSQIVPVLPHKWQCPLPHCCPRRCFNRWIDRKGVSSVTEVLVFPTSQEIKVSWVLEESGGGGGRIGKWEWKRESQPFCSSA